MSDFEVTSSSSSGTSDDAYVPDSPSSEASTNGNHERETMPANEDNQQDTNTVELDDGAMAEAELPETDYKSKRQQRLASISNPGSNGQSKGEVIRESDGSIIWWNADVDNELGTYGDWEDAVYHNDIREDLLAIASSDGRDVYDYPRKRGTDAFDETAFLASQKAWRGEDKQHWPTIADNILNRFESRGYQGPDNEVGWMYFGDRVVLDHNNNPVRNFDHLPATISSAVEPWLLEAFSRIDGRIVKTDIQARMPTTYTGITGRQQRLITPAAIGNRSMRFRETNGLISWMSKAGSDPWKNFIRSNLTPTQIANNSTEGLGTFTKAEIQAAKRENEGKFLSKAGSKRLSDDARQERADKPAKSSRTPIRRKLSKGKISTRRPSKLTSTSMSALPLPTTFPTAGTIDYRFRAPTNEQEAAFIQAALQVTHDVFIRHFNRTAPTSQGQSYSRQWDELQILYTNNTDPTIRADRNMPECLPQLKRWYGGFAAWASVEVMNGFAMDRMLLGNAEEPDYAAMVE